MLYFNCIFLFFTSNKAARTRDAASAMLLELAEHKDIKVRLKNNRYM